MALSAASVTISIMGQGQDLGQDVIPNQRDDLHDILMANALGRDCEFRSRIDSRNKRPQESKEPLPSWPPGQSPAPPTSVSSSPWASYVVPPPPPLSPWTNLPAGLPAPPPPPPAAAAGGWGALPGSSNSGSRHSAPNSGPGKRLRKAAEANNMPEIMEMIKAGANMNDADKSGKTPLHYAARAGAMDAVELLLSLGAEPNVPDFDGLMPCDEADYWAVTQPAGDSGQLRKGCLAVLEVLERWNAQRSDALYVQAIRRRLEILARSRGIAVPWLGALHSSGMD